jgi:hypothetical protein
MGTQPDMQAPPEAGKPGENAARHVYGPRPLGALVPAVVRPAFRKRSPATAQVLADWPAIVGPDLAAVTVPRRLSAGTLTLGCAGPVALELQHLADAVIGRINAHLGRPVVQRLRFVQEAASPPGPAAVTVLPALSAAEDAAARSAVADVPEGPLRDALLALGRAVLARR